MPELDRLREVGDLVRVPAFEELLETRGVRTRQNLVVATTTLAAATALAGFLLSTSGNTRADAPPVDPVPTPTPTVDFEIPAGQTTING